MKRELFQNILAMPYISGSIIDRTGYLSAVVGVIAGEDSIITVTVEHSDDGAAFEAVTDKLVFPEKQTVGGKLTCENHSVEGVVNFDVDLSGLKNFVKFTVEGSTSLAVVLGDSAVQSV